MVLFALQHIEKQFTAGVANQSETKSHISYYVYRKEPYHTHRHTWTSPHLFLQARSQKFAMGGCFGGLGALSPAAGGWGFGGSAPSHRRHGGLGAEPPGLKILHFFAKITSF